MLTRKKILRGIAQAGLVLALTGGAASLLPQSAAGAASYGNPVHNCYGIWWNTDWNQECGSGGASAAGNFQSTADCTAPQVTDERITKYRPLHNGTSYDGPDCNYGIHVVNTVYW
jgi:hypothetical protein